MNVSFDLLSSMSPKINKHYKPVKRAPTKLALKNHIRKSLNLNVLNNSFKNESIITVESSSIYSSSSESRNIIVKTPIVISDSETSFNDKTPLKRLSEELENKSVSIKERKNGRRLSNDKYVDIQHWVDDVNSAKQNSTLFSEVSTILTDDNSNFKQAGSNVAASSSLLDSNSRRLDQLFKKKETSSDSSSYKSCSDNVPSKKNYIEENNLLIKDSLLTEDDSFEMPKNESLLTRIKKKETNKKTEPTIGLTESIEYENLLDSLYGYSWRERKEDILPSSEPRPKASKESVRKKTPKTERHVNKKLIFNGNGDKDENKLLKILQKANFERALESPWTESLNRIRDSESKKQNIDNVLSPVRLNFEEEQDGLEKKMVKPDLDKSSKNSLNRNQNKKAPGVKNKNEVDKTYSFLASLSGSVPEEKCNFSALIFRKEFRQHREKLATKLFELFNEKIFENSIPADTPIEWNDRMRGTAGVCSCKKITRRTGAVERTAKITLSKKVLDSADRLRDTLVHEMCHAATWIVNEVCDGHGAFWKSWACRAMRIFPELPPIKRCHNYVINTKYTYKCTGCGYSIGRHTKSLDIERKRCGYCFGKFEVLLNKTTKQGETKAVPATPKKATGFALFVKENYANFKTPVLKHGDVMKMLGQKFSDMKVNKT